MMLDKMRAWFQGLGGDESEILRRLNSDSVKNGRNRRIGDHSQTTGHVHNSMLPDGGLQHVLSQQNVHVVSFL